MSDRWYEVCVVVGVILLIVVVILVIPETINIVSEMER